MAQNSPLRPPDIVAVDFVDVMKSAVFLICQVLSLLHSPFFVIYVGNFVLLHTVQDNRQDAQPHKCH